MKKIIAAVTIFIALIACNSSGDKKQEDSKPADSTGNSASTAISNNPNYKKGLDLVAKSDCFTCHKIDGELNGPAYKLIAQKYQGVTEEKITTLAQTIIKGSNGNWGEAYMTAHNGLSEEDAKAMVRYVLLLK